MKKRLGLFAVYVILLTVYGAMNADPEFVKELTNGQKVVWMIGLLLFYTALTWLTNKIMAFIGSIFMKLANTREYDPAEAKGRCLNYMLILYYAHILLLFAQKLLSLPAWTVYLNFIGIAVLFFVLVQNRKFSGAGKKIVVSIPFVAYSIVDVIAMNMAG